MAFYVCQAAYDFKFKLGHCDKDERVPQRATEHETSGGPQRLLGWIPGTDLAFEKQIFRRLRAWRFSSDARNAFEIFSPAPEVIAFIKSREFKSLGYVAQESPKDPRRQTAREWLKLVQQIGKGEQIEQAASMALRSDNALRAKVPPSARGGWDLNEAIGGPGYISNQVSFGFAIREEEENGWLIRTIRYKDWTFRFPVFAEMYERQTGKDAPPGAIHTGIRFRPKTEIKKKTLELRKRLRAERARAIDPNQLALGVCK